MKIRAVTFDLWLTLIWDTEELNEYWKLRRLVNFHRFARKNTEGVTLNAVRLAIEESSKEIGTIYESGRDVSLEERGRMIFERLGIRFPEREKERVYAQAGRILSDAGYFARLPNANAEARPTLERLKKNFPGIKIGLISNAGRSSRTYRRMLEELEIAHYFDTLTISCEVGALKPERKIFETTLQALSVEPQEVIHVGDSFKADIVGATSMGMNAALYTGLWHRYARHHYAAGEHIPADFRPSGELTVREISRLQDVLGFVRGL